MVPWEPLTLMGPPQRAPVSVGARLPEGPTYRQVSRKKNPSSCPVSALTCGHPHPGRRWPGRLEGHVPTAQGRAGGPRGAQGARGLGTVRTGTQGRQRPAQEAGWEAMGGTGLGAERGRGQLPRAAGIGDLRKHAVPLPRVDETYTWTWPPGRQPRGAAGLRGVPPQGLALGPAVERGLEKQEKGPHLLPAPT